MLFSRKPRTRSEIVAAADQARAGEDAEARRLLDGLDGRLPPRALRRARRVALRLWPGPRTLWRWLFPSRGRRARALPPAR